MASSTHKPAAAAQAPAITPASPGAIMESDLPKEAVVEPKVQPKSAGEALLETLPENVRTLTLEKVRSGLPLRDAIEVSRAQIAHDSALAESAKANKPATA